MIKDRYPKPRYGHHEEPEEAKRISDVLKYTLQVALISFMLGSLVDVGLKLEHRDAWSALHDRRFVMSSVLSGFIVGPFLPFSLLARWHCRSLTRLDCCCWA